ncbi:MAG: penicillin-binding protein 2, partial [Bacteroidota bacterium]
MDVKRDILRRIYVIYFLICAFGVAVISRAVYVQVVEGPGLRAKAETYTTAVRNIEAVRGNIYAANGSLLATSIPLYEVRMDPNTQALTDEIFFDRVDTLGECLSNLFNDHSPAEYARRLRQARADGQRYYLIKRNVKYTQLKKMRQFPLFRKGRFKGGFLYIQQNKRQRPFQVLAARTIGYARAGIKPVGLEGAYDHELSGVSGKRLMERIAGGVWMPISDENEIEPEDGSDVHTTIDINIQDVAENALLRQLVEQDADHGCVALMEVESGAVLAIANLSRGDDGTYYERYNYAIGESTEPGSTFKLGSYMAAIEDGYINPDDSIDAGDGKYKFYDTYMYDTKKGGYGVISFEQAFAYSSNIAVAKMAVEHYGKKPQDFLNKMYDFHLNDPLGIEIYGEGRPYVKTASDSSWSGISLPWISHGYEVQLTPLQILAYYNAVANGGKLVKPMFVREIRQRGQVVQRFEPEVIDEAICSKSTIKKVRRMLEAVVEYGTARNLRNANFKIAGKTGTAQIANAQYGYRYQSKTSYQASFAGYFPADNPKYSCIVVVNAPS